jgi:hypothetical protein
MSDVHVVALWICMCMCHVLWYVATLSVAMFMAVIEVQRTEINIWIQNVHRLSLCIVGM